jgi:hypothetical protein
MIDKNLNIKALQTYNQFKAIEKYLESYNNVIDCILNNKYYKEKLKTLNNNENDQKVNIEKIKNILFNSWNTERTLILMNDLLSKDDNSFSIQWCFTQAYYSVFLHTLAFIKSMGQNISSHQSVMNKFGELIKENKYPLLISFYTDGGKNDISFHNIQKNFSKNSIDFNENSIISCQIQICQFLKSTRKDLLDEKKNDPNVIKIIKNKERLNKDEWNVISDKLGITHIMNLLYRKRIKSNYKDIDTFIYKKIKALEINKSLIVIVNTMNLIHEAYLRKRLTSECFANFINEFEKINDKKIDFLKNRLNLLNKLE